MSDPYELVYDRDCGFCRWSLGWVLRWDRRRFLVPVALQSPRGYELTEDLGEARMDSAHLVAPDGRRWSGGLAAAPVLRLLPGAAPLARLAERHPRLAERAYRWVAGRRGRFGPLIGEGAKRRADALIASARSSTRGMPGRAGRTR